MTHDELVNEAETLAIEMRKTNVRSFGLKVSKHDDWCRRMRRIADALKAQEEKATKAPPPPPKTAVA